MAAGDVSFTHDSASKGDLLGLLRRFAQRVGLQIFWKRIALGDDKHCCVSYEPEFRRQGRVVWPLPRATPWGTLAEKPAPFLHADKCEVWIDRMRQDGVGVQLHGQYREPANYSEYLEREQLKLDAHQRKRYKIYVMESPQEESTGEDEWEHRHRPRHHSHNNYRQYTWTAGLLQQPVVTVIRITTWSAFLELFLEAAQVRSYQPVQQTVGFDTEGKTPIRFAQFAFESDCFILRCERKWQVDTMLETIARLGITVIVDRLRGGADDDDVLLQEQMNSTSAPLQVRSLYGTLQRAGVIVDDVRVRAEYNAQTGKAELVAEWVYECSLQAMIASVLDSDYYYVKNKGIYFYQGSNGEKCCYWDSVGDVPLYLFVFAATDAFVTRAAFVASHTLGLSKWQDPYPAGVHHIPDVWVANQQLAQRRSEGPDAEWRHRGSPAWGAPAWGETNAAAEPDQQYYNALYTAAIASQVEDAEARLKQLPLVQLADKSAPAAIRSPTFTPLGSESGEAADMWLPYSYTPPGSEAGAAADMEQSPTYSPPLSEPDVAVHV